MDALELIATYERILEVTGRMLEAARNDDWDRLTELERNCKAEVGRLIAQGDRAAELPDDLRARKAQIVRDVLADDAEIRRLTDPWMAQLEQMIGHVHNERRLVRTYES
jgi:flagellar protein FliT